MSETCVEWFSIPAESTVRESCRASLKGLAKLVSQPPLLVGSKTELGNIASIELPGLVNTPFGVIFRAHISSSVDSWHVFIDQYGKIVRADGRIVFDVLLLPTNTPFGNIWLVNFNPVGMESKTEVFDSRGQPVLFNGDRILGITAPKETGIGSLMSIKTKEKQDWRVINSDKQSVLLDGFRIDSFVVIKNTVFGNLTQFTMKRTDNSIFSVVMDRFGQKMRYDGHQVSSFYFPYSEREGDYSVIRVWYTDSTGESKSILLNADGTDRSEKEWGKWHIRLDSR